MLLLNEIKAQIDCMKGISFIAMYAYIILAKNNFKNCNN